MLESVDAKKPLPVKKYLLYSDGASGGDDGKQNDQDDGKKSKKRTIDAVGGSKGKKDDDAKDESSKKAKDGLGKKLSIPIDEGFQSTGMYASFLVGITVVMILTVQATRCISTTLAKSGMLH